MPLINFQFKRILKLHLILPVLLLFPGVSCTEKRAPDPEIVKQYQKNADLFCNAIVDCIKQDVEEHLKSDPVRKNHILDVMNRDLCKKEQYRLIGDLSVNPGKAHVRTDAEIYQHYERCAGAVASAGDCSARREINKTNPDCQILRTVSN